MMVFEFPGISSLQDLGRHGFQNQGVSVSGAMDTLAARVANTLVGNAEHLPVIEIALGGTVVRLQHSQCFAITGADLQAHCDGTEVPLCKPVWLDAGSRLEFRAPVRGCRAYVAVAGGFSAEPMLGSSATDARSGLGGFHGRVFRRGDALPYASTSAPAHKSVSWHTSWANPAFDESTPLPCIAGPQWSMLPKPLQQDFLENRWTLSRHSDRMGLRFEQALTGEFDVPSLLSAGVVFGSVQLPPDRHPIILGADRQTTGGYPHIAAVASIGHRALAQAKPGDQLSFRQIDVEQALQQWRRRELHFREWQQHMQQWWHA